VSSLIRYERERAGFLLACLIGVLAGCHGSRTELAGFSHSPYFDEQVRTWAFDPDVSVHINAPPADEFDPDKPTLLAIYALPNGNTIAQTIGCREEEGLDWHFYIQHIGAQTRYLRQSQPQRNLVVAYVEAEGRSWPAWRRNHADSGARIVELIESLRDSLPGEITTAALSAHSGGGSMLFGAINAVEQIPDWIERIVWLDANYAYRDEEQHAEKLLDWLKRDSRHYLGVVAYDDREIMLNGRKVVGPTGGTFRRTDEMIARFGRLTEIDCEMLDDRTRCRALEGRIDFQVLHNPENKILHTVLVEKNGFIHALSFGTPAADKLGGLFEATVYEEWIQEGSELPG
jgi:hypothetical protein